MFLKVTLNESKNKVVHVEVAPSVVEQSGLIYSYTVEDEAKANKILNNYDMLGVAVNGSTLTLKLFESASEEPSARRKSSETWKTRTRPALMRAAQTAGMFNL